MPLSFAETATIIYDALNSLYPEKDLSSAPQSSQHSVAHTGASDDKNTLKWRWRPSIVLHILKFLWFSMNAWMQSWRGFTGAQTASAVHQSPGKEVESKIKGKKEHFVNRYLGCCSLQQILSFCWSGCEMPHRNALQIYCLIITFVPVIFHLN